MAVVREIAGLEEQRWAALVRISRDGGESTARLSRLIEEAPEIEAARLSELRASLKEVLVAIGKVNRHNGMLINQSLSYIERALKAMAGEDGSSTVYTPEGEIKSRTGRIAVDRKA
jgi:flagellar biosynthesis/type III secretory pathway chaperone